MDFIHEAKKKIQSAIYTKKITHDPRGIPLGTDTLILTLTFRVSKQFEARFLSQHDIDTALLLACSITKLREISSVVAILQTTDDIVDMNTAAKLMNNKQTNSLVNISHKIRFDFLFSTSAPTMALRITNKLSSCDGVTATRLALHTLEALEQSDVAGGIPFKKNPSIMFTLRHKINMVRRISMGLLSALSPMSNVKNQYEIDIPSSARALRAYYSTGRKNHLAQYRGYCIEGDKEVYKKYLAVCQSWADRVGFNEFFTLINLSPLAAPSIVKSASDLLSTSVRYKNVFFPADYPPSGVRWIPLNYIHISKLFINNYGRHDMTFSSKLTSFNWDWVGVAAPIACSGCIYINGVFCFWNRWTIQGLDIIEDLITPEFGESIYKIDQSL